MYTNLLLDFRKIGQAVDIYFKDNYTKYSINTSERERKDKCKEITYNITYDNKKLFLTTFLKGNGRTSLKVKEGKEQEEKEKLAEFIANSSICKMADKSDSNRSMKFKKIDFINFKGTINLIKEEDLCVNIVKSKDDDKLIYKLEGKYNDKIVITYYKTNNNLMIQGTPLTLYNLCLSYINELVDLDDVVDNLEDNYNQNVKKLTVEEQYKIYMPNSYNKHTDKLKKSLLKAVYNLNIDCQKYTCTDLVFEPLRALEGHIKLTLNRDYKVSSPNPYGNLSMFKYNHDNDVVTLLEPTRQKVISIKDRVLYYEKAYKHIVMYRHKYFHWDYPDEFGQDETKQIDNVEDARQLIIDTLKLIDEYYTI